jgi:predicted peroxiredoxin
MVFRTKDMAYRSLAAPAWISTLRDGGARGNARPTSTGREWNMPNDPRELICLVTNGTDHELSSVGFTIANGGVTAGLKVSVFLSSNGVDLVRKRAVDVTQVNPLEPLASLINDFMGRGGVVLACTPCVKSRGYTAEDLLDGVVISGASAIHDKIKAGAATLSF